MPKRLGWIFVTLLVIFTIPLITLVAEAQSTESTGYLPSGVTMTETDTVTTLSTWLQKLITSNKISVLVDLKKIPDTTLDGLLVCQYIPGLKRILSKNSDAYKDQLKASMLHLGFSLLRMDRFLNMLSMIKDNLIKEIKMIMKRVTANFIISKL